MPKVDKKKLQNLRTHNANISAGKAGTMSRSEVRDTLEKDMENFVGSILRTRFGLRQDAKGNDIPAQDISLSQAVKEAYGVEKEVWLAQLGLHPNSVSLTRAAQMLGNDHLTSRSLEELLISHSELANVTSDVPADYRFIIPELIMDAIRIGYEGATLHQNWISSTTQLSQDEVKMPHIKRGNMVPRKIGEAESIPFGSLQFGQKSASTFKIGIGFKVTDELVLQSKINMVAEAMSEVGVDMSIGADVEALNILINGEQTDGSESAPVIGVADTQNGVDYIDLIRATARMRRLKMAPERLISNEEESIEINLLPEFKGFDGIAKLAVLNSLTKRLPDFTNDLFVMPDNQVMLLHKAGAMYKFRFQQYKIERRRNPQTQEDEMFVSDSLGFGIKKRDSRLIIDGDLAFSANGFPSYMDIDSRINQAFRTVQ